MIELYLCDSDVHGRLDRLLNNRLNGRYEILKMPSGKPYIGGNPLYFSLSHSSDKGIFAIYEKPCGVDLELLNGRLHENILNRFSEREQEEILCERDFLKHWTAREAYVKLYGLSILKLFKRLEFYGGKIYLDSLPQNVKFSFYSFDFGVAAVCTEE